MALPLPIFLGLLKLSGRRRRFESAEGLRLAVRKDRHRNSGRPPAVLARRFNIGLIERAGPCYRLAPREGASGTRLLYLHGGAHVAEMSDAHWGLVAELVERSGCEAFVPLYPLAPEAGYREALVMLEPLAQELAREQRPLVLMGDSSGGGLALLLAQRLVALGPRIPDELVLISPWLDLSLAHARNAASRFRDPWLDLPGLAEAARLWARGEAIRHPFVSPLMGSMGGLPRTTVFIGGRDLLIDECRALRDGMIEAEVEVRWVESTEQIHVWPLLPLKDARPARDALVAVVRDVGR